MKLYTLIFVLIAAFSSCKKEKQPELITYTVAINVANGVEFTLFTTGNEPEIFKIGTQRFNASGQTHLAMQKGSNQEVTVVTSGNGEPDVEMIITNSSTKSVIYRHTDKKTITYKFTAE